jgi:hypothetical protein
MVAFFSKYIIFTLKEGQYYLSRKKALNFYLLLSLAKLIAFIIILKKKSKYYY